MGCAKGNTANRLSWIFRDEAIFFANWQEVN